MSTRVVPPKHAIRKIEKHTKQEKPHNDWLMRIILQLTHSGDLPNRRFSPGHVADLSSSEATSESGSSEDKPVDANEATTGSDSDEVEPTTEGDSEEVEPVDPSEATADSDSDEVESAYPSEATTVSSVVQVNAVDPSDEQNEDRSCDAINTELQENLIREHNTAVLLQAGFTLVAQLKAECQAPCVLIDEHGELPRCIQEKQNRVASLKEEARLLKNDPAMEGKERRIA